MEIEKTFKSNTVYVFQRKIGAGGSADVYLYLRETEDCPSQKVVLKILREKNEETLKELINDGEKLSSLNHPCILTTFGYEKVSAKQLALVLEYVEGANLKTVNSHFNPLEREEIAIFIFLKVYGALQAAHAAGVIHGDISAKNVLVSKKGEIKLSDFGISTKGYFDEMAPGVLKGSADYLSPEVWKGESHSFSSDYFSLGILFYELLEGENPFSNYPRNQVPKFLDAFLKKQPWQKFSPSVREILNQLLDLNPSQRELKELPLVLNNEEHVQRLLSKHISETYLGFCEQITRTMTMVVEKLTLKPKSFSFYLAKGVLFLFFSIGPLATGFDYDLNSKRMKPCLLTITSQPWGEVFINNESVGYTPLINLPLKPGFQKVLWRDYNGHEVQKTLVAFSNGVLSLQIKK